MDPGDSCRHLLEEADFSGKDGITEGYWRVDMGHQFAHGREHIYTSISTRTSILTFSLYVRRKARSFTDVILSIPHISHERALQTLILVTQKESSSG